MSALGQKRTLGHVQSMSALPPKADMETFGYSEGRLANDDPRMRTVVLTGTLKDLAAELGLTHEALYRTLAEMASRGEIERRRQTIRLLNPV
jgi:CRP-like cAMP-binding protein